jgi:hypothetical protein
VSVLYSPAAARDTETEDNLPRDPAAGPLARVRDSFVIGNGKGQRLRVTLIRVVDPAQVKFFHGARADDFPAKGKDWWDDRRYVGVRLRLRYIDAGARPDFLTIAGTLLGAVRPSLTLADASDRSYGPDSDAWTLGASPVEDDSVRAIAGTGPNRIIGGIFPVPAAARVEYVRLSLGDVCEWQLGPVTTFHEALAEHAVGLATPSRLIRYAAIAIGEGRGNDAFHALARRSSSDPAEELEAAFKVAVGKRVDEPSVADAARTLTDACLREIIDGRMAPGEGIRWLKSILFPRVEQALGKQPAWDALHLGALAGPGLRRQYLCPIDEQDGRDALIVEVCRQLRTVESV